MFRKITGIGLVVVLALVLAACAPAAEPTVEEPVVMEEEPVVEEAPSIAAIAAGNPDFSTLVAALDAAGLVDTFAGEGEFAVPFAEDVIVCQFACTVSDDAAVVIIVRAIICAGLRVGVFCCSRFGGFTKQAATRILVFIVF